RVAFPVTDTRDAGPGRAQFAAENDPLQPDALRKLAGVERKLFGEHLDERPGQLMVDRFALDLESRHVAGLELLVRDVDVDPVVSPEVRERRRGLRRRSCRLRPGDQEQQSCEYGGLQFKTPSI